LGIVSGSIPASLNRFWKTGSLSPKSAPMPW
jgi:hypothetical protein